MTKDQIENIAKVAGKEAAKETLMSLGIDVTKPIETQRDFAHLRWFREIVESVVKKSILGVTALIGAGIAASVYLGFKVYLQI